MSGEPRSERLPIAGPAAVRRALLDLVRGDVHVLAAMLALTAAAALAAAAMPRLLGMIVDDFQEGAGASRIDLLATVAIGFGIAHLLLTRFAGLAGSRLGERALYRLRGGFVARALALPTHVVERADAGDLTTRNSTDIALVGQALREAAPDFFVATIRIGVLLAAVLLLDPLLGLCVLCGLPLHWVVTRWYLRRAPGDYLAERAAASEVSEVLSAGVEGAKTIEALRMQEQRMDLVARTIAASHRARRRTLFLRTVLFVVVDVGHALPVATTLLLGGYLYSAGGIGLGTAVAGSLYAWQLADPVDQVLMRVEQVQSSLASLARIEGVGEAAVPEPASTGLDGAPDGKGFVAAGVHYAYDGGPDVLGGVDLTVRPGEWLAIVGPSGAGKSTLGKLLAGLEAPTKGTITVQGRQVSALPAHERRRYVLMVTQEHHVFLGTVRDNLAMADPDAGDDAMLAALAAVDAHWIGDLPHGLATELGAGATHLDPGQAQQLALARVVLADPQTVVLDEATALLDPVTARRAERSMAAVLQGRTVVAIAHRLHTAHDADRVAIMERGRIVEIGEHHALVAAGGPYAGLWRSWHGA
ncbi:ABC transporter ATP-binding protein [Actinomadura chokoriensis]|uniref:ABC transporter ATP-binding protein n=1 Tax=Actinomadura chokoriensis TaxID=454156 RepID=A0ABV4QWS2_9ACTN